jgi:hypothetical protein
MTLVTAQMSVSLDGYYAGPRQDDDDASDPKTASGPRWALRYRCLLP